MALPKLKKSYIRLVNPVTNQQLSVRDHTYDNIPTLEVTSRDTLWIFRYDCLVLASQPQFAITLTRQSQFEMEVFSGEPNQIINVAYCDESKVELSIHGTHLGIKDGQVVATRFQFKVEYVSNVESGSQLGRNTQVTHASDYMEDFID